MWRFIIVGACMLAVGYYSSVKHEDDDPWENEDNVVIEYSEDMLQEHEKFLK